MPNLCFDNFIDIYKGLFIISGGRSLLYSKVVHGDIFIYFYCERRFKIRFMNRKVLRAV